MYDEQVVDKIKIEKVHTFYSQSHADRPKKEIVSQLGKIPHKHWNNARELSTYVSQVAEAEIRSMGRSKP